MALALSPPLRCITRSRHFLALVPSCRPWGNTSFNQVLACKFLDSFPPKPHQRHNLAGWLRGRGTMVGPNEKARSRRFRSREEGPSSSRGSRAQLVSVINPPLLYPSNFRIKIQKIPCLVPSRDSPHDRGRICRRPRFFHLPWNHLQIIYVLTQRVKSVPCWSHKHHN